MHCPTIGVAVRNTHIEATNLHDPLTLFEHQGCVYKGIFSAEQCINSRFVYDDIKEVAIICHISNIHASPLELGPLLGIPFGHLLDHMCRDVIIKDALETSVIKFLGKGRVAASQI